jgi:hypothetical protein
MVQAELQNGRWAMLGVAGILFTAVRARRRRRPQLLGRGAGRLRLCRAQRSVARLHSYR